MSHKPGARRTGLPDGPRGRAGRASQADEPGGPGGQMRGPVNSEPAEESREPGEQETRGDTGYDFIFLFFEIVSMVGEPNKNDGGSPDCSRNKS
jgi:hypothetical protein